MYASQSWTKDLIADTLIAAKDAGLLGGGGGGSSSSDESMVSMDVYSTDEIVVGKWVNGKPLYRQILDVQFYVTSSSFYEMSKPISDIETLCSIGLYGFRGSYTSGKPLFTHGGGYIDDTKLYVASDEVNIYTKKMMLEYTKTTDAENSFNINMLSYQNPIDKLISNYYSNLDTYNVGDFCICGEYLYKCKISCNGIEPPNDIYWEQVQIVDELSDGENSINVVDNLTSDSTTDALSANQGKVLKDSIDNLQIGGRNLLRYTDFKDDSKWDKSELATITNGIGELASNGEKTAEIFRKDSISAKSGDVFTFSVNVITNTLVGGNGFRLYVYCTGTNSNGSSCSIYPAYATLPDNFTGVYSYTWTVPNGVTLTKLGMNMVAYNCTSGEATVNHYKVERGNKATDWTVAPEDTDEFIGIIQSTANMVTDKMDKTNPIGTGSFSLNRKADTSIGYNSFAEGNDATASGSCSHAEGYSTTASGDYSHAEGENTKASGDYSHAEGYKTTASSMYSHAEGYATTSYGYMGHAEGWAAKAYGLASHAEGHSSIAYGDYSHAEGDNTKANNCQHVQGKYNIEDTTSAFIIGNGTDDDNRSNAVTVDWDGNMVLSGSLTCNSISSIASAYDSTVTYTAGDYCYYNSNLYRCILQCADTLPTDTTYWKQVTVMSAIQEAIQGAIGGSY